VFESSCDNVCLRLYLKKPGKLWETVYRWRVGILMLQDSLSMSLKIFGLSKVLAGDGMVNLNVSTYNLKVYISPTAWIHHNTNTRKLYVCTNGCLILININQVLQLFLFLYMRISLFTCQIIIIIKIIIIIIIIGVVFTA